MNRPNFTIVHLRYTQHKANAKARGIAFTLTLEEWTGVWGDKFALRGPKLGQYVMARKNDQGGYTPGNVEIIPAQANNRDIQSNMTPAELEAYRAKLRFNHPNRGKPRSEADRKAISDGHRAGRR
jgi:hypothetical protein